ncbi:polysaccharide biosynthesis/export family protein [Alteromonas facilis]|uniref:polysaccharide biosynthesis/export family protein n=1 Tax=Alteromonas facilis TaxID=2048004 RepID=UPI000C28C4D6|nr:SLBB domain-containing protein [Alteromonas facilis]
MLPDKRFIINVVSCVILFFTGTSFSQSLTNQQIQQFKALPKAQQETLARQMGFDLSILSQQRYGSTNTKSNSTEAEEPFTYSSYANNQDSELSSLETEDVELTLYGSDVFSPNNANSNLNPTIMVPDSFILKSGDEILLRVYGTENFEYVLLVESDGNVIVPRLGPISVAGLSFGEAKDYVKSVVERQITGSKAIVTMGNISTLNIFVAGEVTNPGRYNVSSLSSLTEALIASGGVTDIASLRQIQIKRGGKTVSTFDLYELLSHGNASDNVRLQTNDVVFVPALQFSIEVDGQVRRPAIYELSGENKLREVLSLAAGVLPDAFTKAISIERVINGQRVQLTANLNEDNFTVLPGDRIFVDKTSDYVGSSVYLLGAVARPGAYQWHEGLLLSKLLGNIDESLLPNADFTYVLIVREIEGHSKRIETWQVDLTLGPLQENGDIVLEEKDQIIVFSSQEEKIYLPSTIKAYAQTEKELEQWSEEMWEKRIREDEFLQSIGVLEGTENNQSDSEERQAIPRIKLTEEEINELREMSEVSLFSRKNLLRPVLKALERQAGVGEPISIFEVAGEVKVPGKYPLTKNLSVLGAIKAASGLTESAFLSRAEITRLELDPNGEANINHLEFEPKTFLAGSKDSLTIKSRDRLNFFSIPEWQEELKVVVKGEVKFPGEYTVKRGETLTQLLERVGGVTDFGDLEAALFTREDLRVKERENLKRLAEELRKQIASESLRQQKGAGSVISYDQAKELLKDLVSAEAVGRLVIDLPAILSSSHSSDVTLQDGDQLIIPSITQSVNVIGEVYVPTSHLYSERLTLDEYIELSGGTRGLADENRIYVIRKNGSVMIPGAQSYWFGSNRESASIRPGDTIVVPFDSDNVDNLTLWSNATQIIYQLAVAVAAIGSL